MPYEIRIGILTFRNLHLQSGGYLVITKLKTFPTTGMSASEKHQLVLVLRLLGPTATAGLKGKSRTLKNCSWLDKTVLIVSCSLSWVRLK